MKTRIILSVTMVALLTGLVIAATTRVTGRYMAAVWQEDIGTIRNCQKRCGARLDNGLSFTTTGVGSATWLANSAPDEAVLWSDVQISNFTASGQTPELGTVQFSADDSRLLISRIEGSADGGAFPANATLRIHANATIAGVRYRTITPIEVQGTIHSWPQRDVLYTQIGVSDLERADRPGQIALRLTNVTTTMSGL